MTESVRTAALAEGELVVLARRGDATAFRTIMQRHNRRLFRAARGVLHDDAEAEDVVQEAYARAFQALGGFRGECGLSTWLTRIALNEASGRLRRRRTSVALEVLDATAAASRGGGQGAPVLPFPGSPRSEGGDPEGAAARSEVRRLLKEAIDELPRSFRAVLVLRALEEVSVKETATLLGLRQETVSTRLHRARRLLRIALAGPDGDEEPILPDSARGGARLRPPIVLSEQDHGSLVVLARTVARRSPRVARLLKEETDRAEVVSAERLPTDSVAVGSLVDFRDATSGGRQRVRLVLPAAAAAGEGRVSVLSLVGAGLIGLSAGQSIDWPTQGGRIRRLSVLRVGAAPARASGARVC